MWRGIARVEPPTLWLVDDLLKAPSQGEWQEDFNHRADYTLCNVEIRAEPHTETGIFKTNIVIAQSLQYVHWAILYCLLPWPVTKALNLFLEQSKTI